MTISPEDTPLLALCDATIFTGEAMVENHALLIQDGRVKDIVPNARVPLLAQTQSWSQHILVPGFIDTQVNGGGNILFNATPTVGACVDIARAHQKYGTTRLLLTFISDKIQSTHQAIEAIHKARQSCTNILGLHIEGPHLSIEKRGIHNGDYIRPLTTIDIASYRRQADEIILVTLAPENVTPQQIELLHNNGAIISIGHSNADAEQIYAALAAGATGFTHLFNGMGMMSARAPGVAGVALDDGRSWCGLIVDGHHVSPEMVRLAIHAKAYGKIMLVSDAMSPSATDKPTPFTLYDQAITIENGRCVGPDGCLAGSSITISDAVKKCVQLGVDIEESLRMASTYPAAFLGLESELGKLLPTYTADIVALDYEFNPKNAWVAGQQLSD